MCGNSFIQVANALKPQLNSAGDSVVDQLINGVAELNGLIVAGDIPRIAANFESIGAAGLRNLASCTSNLCLEQTFLLLAEVDSFVAVILPYISDRAEVAEIVCNTLNYKAQRLNSCLPSPCVILY